MVCVPVFYIAGAGSTIFWIIGNGIAMGTSIGMGLGWVWSVCAII